MSETTWIVSIEQKKPFEMHVLEIFTEEEDALAWAETYMKVRPGRKISKRRWSWTMNDGPAQYLVVWKR